MISVEDLGHVVYTACFDRGLNSRECYMQIADFMAVRLEDIQPIVEKYRFSKKGLEKVVKRLIELKRPPISYIIYDINTVDDGNIT